MYKIDFNEPIHIHFIGIGGISMSGLAESPLTKKLVSEGAHIIYGQKAENITRDIGCVVYTAAINRNNPELIEAVALKIPMLTRAELLGQLMKNYDTPIAVSGTHGKTTTTSMISSKIWKIFVIHFISLRNCFLKTELLLSMPRSKIMPRYTKVFPAMS